MEKLDSKNNSGHIFDVQVKEEPELIIDSDGQWIPDEEDEYYQEYFEESSQVNIDGVSELETYTIKFLDESNNYIDNESDYCSEGEEEYENSDEDFDALKNCFDGVDSNKPEYINSEVQMQINRWLTDNFVEYGCPVCIERFSKYKELEQHLEQNHKESIVETEKIYCVGSDNSGVCKKCHKDISTISFRFFHAMKHEKNDEKLEINICKVCNFRTKKGIFVEKHIFEKHPEVMKDFEIVHDFSNIKKKCPLCSYNCKTRKEIWYHFMDKHSDKYKAEIIYNCHLCVCEPFDTEERFLKHLAETHKLNSWQTLNFSKIIEDREFVACLECGSLFVEHDTLKLLKHFLKHENNSSWTCKFCSKEFSFQKVQRRHICFKLTEHFNNYNYDTNSIDNCHDKKECRIKNLQEFENYIAHVCPFCNKEFSTMLKWRQHLKKLHAIETLQGLEMRKLVNDDNKLCCVICHALVVNSPEKLHAHRFQHLPFKPYKCVSCSCALSTFKMAANHISKRCKDEDDRSLVKNFDDSVSDIRFFLEMHCSLCNHRKFNDVKSSFKHYEEQHNNFEELFTKNSDNSMTCKICYKQVVHRVKNPCFLHIINHFDEKTFKCKLCLQSYATLKGINYHFLAHPSTKSFYQQACKKKIETTVSSHERNERVTTNVTKLAVSSIKSYVLNEFAEFIGFVCPECNEDMGSQPIWHTHIAAQHNFFKQSEIYFKDVDGYLKCTTCKMKLPTSTIQQQKHKLTHMPYKSFMCNLCYVRCNSLGVLYGHFRRKHFAKGSFQCPLCPEILQTSHQRTKHLTDKHPRYEWPDSMCLICYKILATAPGLRTHMKIHDINRLKYTCEVCSAKIIELKDFNSHMERHKKKGEVKDEFNNDMTSHSKLPDDHCNDIMAQAQFLDKCRNYKENQNEDNLNEKSKLLDEFKDQIQNKYLENDDHDEVVPVTKKKKYASEEV